MSGRNDADEAWSLVHFLRKRVNELEGELEMSEQRRGYELDTIQSRLDKALGELSNAWREIDRLNGIPPGSSIDGPEW